VGCEYKPAGLTEDGLGWLASARRALDGASALA
jgi:hydroxypyruvate isomerase